MIIDQSGPNYFFRRGKIGFSLESRAKKPFLALLLKSSSKYLLWRLHTPCNLVVLDASIIKAIAVMKEATDASGTSLNVYHTHRSHSFLYSPSWELEILYFFIASKNIYSETTNNDITCSYINVFEIHKNYYSYIVLRFVPATVCSWQFLLILRQGFKVSSSVCGVKQQQSR